MKRNLFIILAIFSFVSCNILQETVIYFEKPARIVVSAGESENARTVFAESVSLDSLQFVLEGKCGEDELNKTWASYSAMKNDDAIFLQPGKWKFSLTVQDANEDVFYTSELEQQIVNGDNPLHFELIETSGTGGVEVKLSFADGSGIESVKAVIKNISDKSEVAGTSQTLTPVNNSVTYTKTDIPSGNYILQFDFYNGLNQQIFLGVMEIIQIKKGRTSKKVMPKIEKFETANFDYGVIAVKSGDDISKFIKSKPKNMPASSFTWKTDKDNVSVNNNGEIVVTGTISEYPLVVEVTATPKNNGGKPVACTVVIDDDLSLNRTELQKVCAAKGIDYMTMTEFEIPYGYKKIYDTDTSGTFASLPLTKVTLPETLEEIGDYSFQSCTSLETINGNNTLPKGLKSISKGAFNNCISLTKITIPGSVDSIGEMCIPEAISGYPYGYHPTGSFSGCIGLQEIIIEEGVKQIGHQAFYGSYYVSGVGSVYNTSITKISISKSVQTIDVKAFEYMQHRTTDISDAPEVKLEFTECKNPNNTAELTILGSAFRYSDGFRTVTLPNNLKYLGTVLESGDFDYRKCVAFEDCKNIKEVIFEGEKIVDGKPVGNSICEIIAYGSFNHCGSIETIVLPRTKPGIETKIGYAAFETNKNVKSLVFPGNIVEIGEWSFGQLENLSELVFEEGVKIIGPSAFAYSGYPMRRLELPSTIEEIGDIALYNFGSYCNATDKFSFILKSKTPPKLYSISMPASLYVRYYVPEESIYAYYEAPNLESRWNSYNYKDELGVIGKNTILLKFANGSNGWFDTNENGIKDEGEKDYHFVVMDPATTEGAKIDVSSLPRPIETGKTTPGIIEWWDDKWWYDGYTNIVNQFENPTSKEEISTLYANIISGISLDSLVDKDISISYNGTEKTLTAPDGYKSYKWFIDGEEKSETSRILSFSSLATGVYKVVVFTQDAKGNIYSASYNLKI